MHYRYFTLEQRNELVQVMSGLPETERRPLNSPEFGVCEACGGDIPFVRLLGNPRLRRCPACEA